MKQGESLDRRLAEEEPEADPYVDEAAESDHEDENALDEQIGLDEADERTGRFVQADQDTTRDVGIDGAGASAEEAAMHYTRAPEPPF